MRRNLEKKMYSPRFLSAVKAVYHQGGLRSSDEWETTP